MESLRFDRNARNPPRLRHQDGAVRDRVAATRDCRRYHDRHDSRAGCGPDLDPDRRHRAYRRRALAGVAEIGPRGWTTKLRVVYACNDPEPVTEHLIPRARLTRYKLRSQQQQISRVRLFSGGWSKVG